MEEEVEKYRNRCLELCGRLLEALERNREDARWFCSGDIRKTYDVANERVADGVRKTQRKIRNL